MNRAAAPGPRLGTRQAAPDAETGNPHRAPVTDSLHTRLERALRAGARAFWLVTDEEPRALALLEDLGDLLGWPVHTWSATGGDAGARRPLGDLLHELARAREPALWLLLDGAPAPHDALALRALRELGQRREGPAVLVISPHEPPAAQPELLHLHLPLPDREALARALIDHGRRLEAAGHPSAATTLQAAAEPLARLALGLPLRAVLHLTTEGLLARGRDPAALTAFVAAHKPDALGHGGLLERVAPAPEDLLGGLDALKSWLHRRALALRPAARSAAIPDPRGVLLVGVQGCGKSLAARTTAAVLDLPLVRLDPGRLFGGTVGESERNLRRLTDLAERLAPLVLWIDEIDKGLAGADASASDGGTAARVVGGLLTWLQERTRPVFVVATANRVDRLPPELLRRGRLDEVFFVDLPGPDDRAQILRIHLEVAPARALGQAPPLADPLHAYLDLARAADGFSGAELEAALVEARLDAFADARPLAAADLARALTATVPLSRAREAEVTALRAWARAAARPA